MLTWSYFAALLTDPGEVPIGWHPFPDDAVSLAAAAAAAPAHTHCPQSTCACGSKQRQLNAARPLNRSSVGLMLSVWAPCVLLGLCAGTQTAARELELLQFADYYIDRRDPRRPRFCKHCKSWKPERTHHCSVMGRCVLKMVGGGSALPPSRLGAWAGRVRWWEQQELVWSCSLNKICNCRGCPKLAR